MANIESLVQGIHLIEVAKSVDAADLKKLFPGQSIIVCDAYVSDIEKTGRAITGGFALGEDFINIDHHAPVSEMERIISSTPLAIEFIKQFGRVGEDVVVVINHMDADSMLSSAVIRGLIDPEERFAEAAVAADHSGADNELADLLQGCGQERDLEFSWRSLQLWLAGKPLEARAQVLLDKQRQQRRQAEELVREGKFAMTEAGVAWVYVEDRIDGAFFPALLPEATVIVQFSPKGPGRLRVGYRLGLAAPAGMTLHTLGIEQFDRSFGGRWNAGNNSRAGGTDLGIEDYVTKLNKVVAEAL